MDTVTDRIRKKANEIKSLAHELLMRHSALVLDPDANDLASDLLLITSPAGNYSWSPLSVEGRRVQSRLRDEYDHLFAILRTLMHRQQPDVCQERTDGFYSIESIIDQRFRTWLQTTEEAAAKFDALLDAQIDLVANLYDSTEGEHIFVPDTHALLYNPAIEDWVFNDAPTFTLTLIPPVLLELDRLQYVHRYVHRNEELGKNAEGVIRRIKRFRSHDRLTEGVTLRANRSTLRSTAIGPNMDRTLFWLRSQNNDDEILASVLELMCQHPRCPVLLVTRDLNLQNKAEFAGLPFVEPPEPMTSTS